MTGVICQGQGRSKSLGCALPPASTGIGIGGCQPHDHVAVADQRLDEVCAAVETTKDTPTEAVGAIADPDSGCRRRDGHSDGR